MSGRCNVAGVQILAGSPGARDHIELHSCQNGINANKLRSESLCKRNQTGEPGSILGRNRFGNQNEKVDDWTMQIRKAAIWWTL